MCFHKPSITLKGQDYWVNGMEFIVDKYPYCFYKNYI